MDKTNVRLVEEIFRDAKFIHALGIELVGCGFGWCESKMAKSEGLQQQHGFVHAGALMTLADHTCGGAAASTMPEGKDVITVENKVSFLRPATGKHMICRATVLRSGRTLVFVEAEIVVERDETTSFYGVTLSAEVFALPGGKAQLATHFDAKNSISAFLCGTLPVASGTTISDCGPSAALKVH